jgi:hypothetical protein
MDSRATGIERMRRKRGEGGEGKPRPGFAVFARIRAEVGEALQEFMQAQRFPPTIARVVEQALEEFLAREGFEAKEVR